MPAKTISPCSLSVRLFVGRAHQHLERLVHRLGVGTVVVRTGALLGAGEQRGTSMTLPPVESPPTLSSSPVVPRPACQTEDP